jgi:SPP1 gp7 family putative phage head morphogenesis protein
MAFSLFGGRLSFGKPAPAAAPAAGPKKKIRPARGQKSDRLAERVEQATSYHRAKAEMEALVLAENRARAVTYPRRDRLIYLYKQIVKDGYLTGQIKTLKNKVLSEGFAVVDKATGQEDNDVLELLQRPWFHEFMNAYLDTDFWGHTLLNFTYPAADGEHVGEFLSFDLIPRENVVPEVGEVLLRPTDTVGIPFRNTEAPYTKLLVEIALRDEAGEYTLGILAKASPEVIWKRYARSDWSRRSEKFGMPLVGLATSAVERSELDDKEEALANLGSDGYILLEEDEELTFHEAKGNDSGQMYSALSATCNNEIAYLITGQTMTSQDGSSKSQGEVHERVQEHYIQERQRSLSYFINFNLFPFLRMWGYPMEGMEFKWRGLLDEEAAKAAFAEAPDDGQDDPNGGTNDPEGAGPQDGRKPGKKTPGAPAKGKAKAAPAKQKLSLKTPNFTKPVAQASATGRMKLANTDKESPKLRTLFDRVMDKLHAESPKLRKMMRSPEFKAMMVETGNQLSAAVSEGYGAKLESLEYGTPDAVLLGKLTTSLYIFSANKSYSLLVELNQLLVKDGKVREYKDFKTEALKLHEDYNINWLKTEYDTALATGQMAAKWVDFQRNADDYFLKYSTVGDARVRPAHADLDGITLPVDDPFWNTHYPPLGFKCRCDVVRVPRQGRTATSQAHLDSLDAHAVDFGHNAGKTGVVFPESHQYNDIPDGVKPILRNMAREAAPTSKPKK